MFEIRKIKPVHGWREFAGEVGIIVVGVLIALTAEQLTETWHWRHEAGEARASLGSELADTSALVQERELYARCIARRIRDISALLDEASTTGRLPPIGSIGQPSVRSYELPTWTALTASGVASRLPREEVLIYGQLANGGKEMTDLNRAEMVNWADVFSIVGPGRPIGLDEVGQLRRSLGEIGYRAKLIRLWGNAIREQIRESRVPLDQARLAEARSDWPHTIARVRSVSICQPIARAPVGYGQAPFDRYSLEGPVAQDR
ncbi:hypothetical protein [uncultured Sphingomonas sp.]|uniref:hypothetical protein n=1 Tax=uncultured Sphingomonas sp. TaxID=158754 RepID=UPI0035CC1735